MTPSSSGVTADVSLSSEKREPELWEKAFKILGKSREARLMVLGLLLMTTGGGSLYILQAIGISSPLSALFLVFGILSFITGFGLYVDKAEKGSSRASSKRKGSKKKSAASDQ